MKLSFSVKSIGKKKAFIESVSIDLDLESNTTIKALLEKLIIHQVDEYNKRKEDPNLIYFLNESAIKEKSEDGNIKFNEQYNKKIAKQDKAIEIVFQAFEDGLIAFFLNGNQFENLNDSISINESDSVTIIKLSFLAGSIW